MSNEEVSTEEARPRPDELESRLDDITESATEGGGGGGTSPSMSPNNPREQEEMSVAGAEHKQDPNQQTGGGQFGG